MPAAPAAPPAIVPSTPAPTSSKSGSALPSSSGVIHVGAGGGLETPSKEADPTTPRPNQAREEMRARLQKRADKTAEAQSPATTPEPVKPAAAPAVSEAKTGDEPAKASEDTAKATTEPTKAKVNPWKLLDEHKAARAKAEAEALELRKLVPNETARKAELAEVEATKTRNKELEDAIRFVDYQKSKEFDEKYQQPYKKAWAKAMADLNEITVENAETGESRAMTPQDMLQLVNLPLGQARRLADEMYGPLANDVMAHRNKLKELWDAQADALETARTSGEERHKKLTDEYAAKQKQINDVVTEAWTKANEAALQDAKYGPLFNPTEGDQDGNQRLAKGFELVDRAFKENPLNPELTTEERQSIAKRHAAVRYRAAAFGRLFAQHQKLNSEMAELKKKLGQYEGSVPGTTGSQSQNGNGTSADPREAMHQRLMKMAK